MSGTVADSPIDLLLSDAEARMPVLERGLPESTLTAATAPAEPRGAGSLFLDAPDRDPNLLDLQRWGVIAPEGPVGDLLLGAIAGLIEHRRAEQGTKPRIYRVPPGQDSAAAIRWRDEVLRAERVPEHERPRYLLLLGELTQVSLELQQTLAHGCFVGRLALDDEAAYGAYADKVIGWERSARELPRALYYTAQDGTAAISAGYRHLIQPCVEMAERWRGAGKLELAEAVTVPYADDGPGALIEAAGSREASVLLSLSHGLGAPRRGWRSAEQQRRTQGALCLGLDGEPLSAESLGSAPFLPGGVWLMIACFGAGTPGDSAYLPWLQALAASGGEGRAAAEVLRSLPRAGEPPFLAALPQAALANPKGPLAVIGHVDLAWSFAFMDGGRGSRASRIFGAMRALLSGSRAGVALDSLMQAYREANDDLSSGYQLQREAAARGQAYAGDARKVAQLWMRRNDLRGYLLLGDPAAHLPLARARARLGEPGMPSVLIDLRDPQRAALLGRRAAAKDGADDAVPKDRQAGGGDAADMSVSRDRSSVVDEAVSRDRSVAVDEAVSRDRSVVAADGPVSRDRSVIAADGPVSRDRSVVAEEVDVSRDRPVEAPRGQQAGGGGVAREGHAVAVSAGGRPAAVSGGAASGGPVAVGGGARGSVEADAARRRERAVLALLRGAEAPQAIAAGCGVTLDDLFEWLERYREGGRRELDG
ncbi:MAG: hypothetical protein IPO88_31420 [Nannocystis sp.]|uniref:hypothetical protein n=1 Tax=Nannocystis sp. TaxID=1962667 RepID=UPI002423B5A7|nr:hypothetical protein [Nannocystis sp.]MBK9757946.1 hypothetical protein [Nannocystis sp.]